MGVAGGTALAEIELDEFAHITPGFPARIPRPAVMVSSDDMPFNQ
jgi:hypothetical protein